MDLKNRRSAVRNFGYGNPTDLRMSGDWNGNFGIFRPADQKFFLFTTSCVGLAPQPPTSCGR